MYSDEKKTFTTGAAKCKGVKDCNTPKKCQQIMGKLLYILCVKGIYFINFLASFSCFFLSGIAIFAKEDCISTFVSVWDWGL